MATPENQGIITEAGLFIITESGDYIVTEAFTTQGGGKAKPLEVKEDNSELWEIGASIYRINDNSLKEPVNIKKYILSEGFNVLELATADVPFLQLHAKTPDEIADLCIGVIEKYSDLDALYVPCPQWQAMDAVKKIEEKTGVTVIASDPADFWVAFKHLGIQAVSEEYGHLLSLL